MATIRKRCISRFQIQKTISIRFAPIFRSQTPSLLHAVHIVYLCSGPFTKKKTEFRKLAPWESIMHFPIIFQNGLHTPLKSNNKNYQHVVTMLCRQSDDFDNFCLIRIAIYVFFFSFFFGERERESCGTKVHRKDIINVI